MTLQVKKTKQDVEATPQPIITPPTLIVKAYKIERAYPHFYMIVYDLLSDGTYTVSGSTDKESLPMVLNRLNKLSLKGLGKL